MPTSYASPRGNTHAHASADFHAYSGVPTATPIPFQPLSSEELKELLDRLVRPVRQTFSTTYSAQVGPVHSDNSNLLLEVFENTYFHLTGKSLQNRRDT